MQDLGAADLLNRQLAPPSRLQLAWDTTTARLSPRLPAPVRRALSRRSPLNWLLRALLFPFILLVTLIWRLVSLLAAAVWTLLGRLGLALRDLLTWFLWRPLWLLTAPLRWPIRRLLGPILLAPLGRWLARLARAIWESTEPRRRRLARRWRSRRMLLLARLRLFWRHPAPPAKAVFVPEAASGLAYADARARGRRRARLRLVRAGGAFLAINLTIAGLGSLFADAPPAGLVDASPALPAAAAGPVLPAATHTPTPAPTATPEPLPTLEMAAWPTPDLLGGGGSVLFTMAQAGNADLYALTLGQAEPVRLTDHPAADRDPAWSPDGSQIAFASRRDGDWELYVLDLRAGSLRRVTQDPGFDAGPSWSPDGQWLVYEAYQDNNLDIYITRADGSGQAIRLTHHPAPDFSPVWAPGGRHIAFTSWRTGNKDIFILPLDEADEQRAINVTFSPDRHEDNAAFSPDGALLAFDDDSSGFDVVSGVTLRNYRPDGPLLTLGQGRQPAWAPDGSALLFVHEAAGRHFLFAGSFAAWNIAPQAFASADPLDDPVWSSTRLPPDLAARLGVEPGNEPLFEERLARPTDGGPPVLLQRVAVSAPAPYLSDRVDDSFQALRDRLAAEAGVDALGQVDNLFEPLAARAEPGLDPRSWNKAGRAFDLAYRPALAFDPQMEVVRQDRGYEVTWVVYYKAAAQDGSQGEPLRDLPWDFRARYGQDARYYDEGGKWKDVIPSGYYVNFTALASAYGWEPVPADVGWRHYFPGIRFWHFESRGGLSWEAAMAEIHGPEALADGLRAP